MPYGIIDLYTGGTAGGNYNNNGYVYDNNNGTYAQRTQTTAYTTYQLPAAKKAGYLRMIETTGSKDSPKDFTFQGSNNGSTYVTLYTGIHANNTSWQTFYINCNTPYLYYKVDITTNWGGGYQRLSELELYEYIPSKGGFSGVSNPWIFFKDAFENNKKLWKGKKLLLPKDLGFEY